MAPWKKTFYTAWIAQFLSITGFTFVLPFLPLYVQRLGIKGDEESAFWAGICTAATATTLFLFSPLWGFLADRYGRKPMVLRSMFSAAVILAAMGFAQNVWQLAALRALQGCLTGTVTASTALVASVAPRNRSGYALGMMQSAVFVGAAVGPLIGGVLSEFLGYRAAFIGSGVLLLAGGLLVHFAAREDFTPHRLLDRSERGTFRQVFAATGFVAVVFTLLAVRFANHVAAPVFPILVKRLWGANEGVTFLTGGIYAAAGVAVFFSAGRFGRLGQRWGHKPLLFTFALGAGVISILYVPATTVSEVFVLRVLFGVAAAGLMASGNTLIHERVEDRNIGKAYGVTSSVAALGMALGPLTGGYLALSAGLRTPFMVTAVLFVLTAVLIGLCIRPMVPAGAAAPDRNTAGGNGALFSEE